MFTDATTLKRVLELLGVLKPIDTVQQPLPHNEEYYQTTDAAGGAVGIAYRHNHEYGTRTLSNARSII